MDLRDYQKQAVRRIIDCINENKIISRKLRVELQTGLGRMSVISAAAKELVNGSNSVLILSPNQFTCDQIAQTFGTESQESLGDSGQKEHQIKGVTITTFCNFEE